MLLSVTPAIVGNQGLTDRETGHYGIPTTIPLSNMIPQQDTQQTVKGLA